MATSYKSKFTGEQIDNSVKTVVSNTAKNGQVLTANGRGGATWQDPAGGGTEVVANPVLAGNESDLTGLEVAGTKYKVPSGGGTEVVANPTGNATQELSKIQVGGTVYSIPEGSGSGGGTKLYSHTVDINDEIYTFIMPSNEEINSRTPLAQIFANSISVQYYYNFILSFKFSDMEGYSGTIYYINNGAINSREISSSSIFSDIVTPL